MVATILAAATLAAASQPHPCRTPLPHGPAVPAPIVLWTSCGSFRLAPGGRLSRLPRHWLALHGSGTGRRYGAHLDVRRTRPGRFLVLLHGRVVWRSARLYPRDGGSVAFGPHALAFASYRRGIFLTNLRGAERLVAPGRGLYPYSFTGNGDLIVTGSRTIRLVSPDGATLRRFTYRPRNGYSFDEQTDNLYFVTPAGRLATAHGTRITFGRALAELYGMVTVARPNLLVFFGAHSITATKRDGTVIAEAQWKAHQLSSDSGVAVSPDGNAFAFRLSDAHPGSRSSTATVYLLGAGSSRARAIYRHRLGPSGCAVGANLSWQGTNVLYSSSDGTLAILDTTTGTAVDLTTLARTLPHRATAERAYASWRRDFRR
ncbi:MAG: hypothetical protein JWO17_1762 [Actinomycetia bacterium]|nr:hypothetical protein [Actinomycetes bacterium]